MAFKRLLATSFALLVVCLIGSAQARAAGGRYTFDGGTPREQAQVRSALAASAFDWNLVPGRIVIHIARGLPSSEAAPGEIWLDADLLDAGAFSWGVVQHEYAHEVDFFLLDAASRAALNARLGGRDWCGEVANLKHGDHGCERFASTLAWAYWPSPLNCMRPESAQDEAGAMTPAAFRTLLHRLIAAPATLSLRRTASAQRSAGTSHAPRGRGK